MIIPILNGDRNASKPDASIELAQLILSDFLFSATNSLSGGNPSPTPEEQGTSAAGHCHQEEEYPDRRAAVLETPQNSVLEGVGNCNRLCASGV